MTRCAYRDCRRPATGFFRAFPGREVRAFCADCRARIESTGLALTPVEGWAGRAVRHELPPRIEETS